MLALGSRDPGRSTPEGGPVPPIEGSRSDAAESAQMICADKSNTCRSPAPRSEGIDSVAAERWRVGARPGWRPGIRMALSSLDVWTLCPL